MRWNVFSLYTIEYTVTCEYMEKLNCSLAMTTGKELQARRDYIRQDIGNPCFGNMGYNLCIGQWEKMQRNAPAAMDWLAAGI